jgi:sugar lactone lactonase YvrE
VRNRILLAVLCVTAIVSLAPCSFSQLIYATSETSKTIEEVNMATGTLTVLYTSTSTLDSLIVDSQGRILYTTTKSGTVSMFDPSTGVNTVVASGFTAPRDLVFDPGQTSLLVSNYGKSEIDRVNLLTGTWTPLIKKLGSVDGLAYDPQGNFFAAINHHTQIAQIDPTTGVILKTLTVVTNHTVGFYGLDGLVYDPYTGELWATDVGTGANCLVEIPTDLSTFKLVQVGNFSNPDGLTSDGNGNLFVGVAYAKAYEYNIPTDTVTAKAKVPNIDDTAMVPVN